MSRRFAHATLWLLCLSALFGAATAMADGPQAAPAAAPATTTYTFAKDIAYRQDEVPGGEACRLDVYYPEDATDFTTVVWFHAGGLKRGKRYVPGKLRERGIAVVAVDYRLSPDVKSPAYIEDAAAAVAWVFTHIADYGGSPDRIIVSGASAGGYLTLLLGLDRRWLAAHDVEANRIAGLVALSGQAITHFTVRTERGGRGTRPEIDDLAPLYHVRGDAPPILLVTGDRELELLGRYEENAYLRRMLIVAGHKDVTLHELDGKNHSGVEAAAYPLFQDFVARIQAAPIRTVAK